MGGGANVAVRELGSPGSGQLAYAISSSGEGFVNRGETLRTDTASGTGSRSDQSPASQHLISANRYLGAGAYFDTMIVTVTF
jgi:spore coat protein U-like protein